MKLFTLLIAKPSLKEIIDFRYALEYDILEQILIKEEHFDDLTAKLEENTKRQNMLLKENAPLDEQVKNDQCFHLLLSESCGNILFQTIYNYIMEYIEPYMRQTSERQNMTGEDFATRDHQNLTKALKTRDLKEIKGALQNSLHTWQQYMSEDDL